MKVTRTLAVLLYAAFIGVLLASYVTVLQQISEYRTEIATLEEAVGETREYNASQERMISDLNTPAGIERAARERYGMIKPGEEVYILPEKGE